MLLRFLRAVLCVCAALLGWLAAAQGVALQRVQVVAVDLSGNPVAGAAVVLSVPGLPEQKGSTDSAGIASFDVGVAGPVTVAVSISKEGFNVARDVLDLGKAASSDTPKLEVVLTRTDQTVLIVTVRGPSGTLPNIPITVTHDRQFGGGPTYRGMTGADGMARIVVSTGRSVAERLTGTTFRVAASHPNSAEQQDPREAVSAKVSVSYQVPSRSVDLLLIEGSIDTSSGMPVLVSVKDEEGPVAGASVVLRGREASDARSGVTDASGTALMEASVIFAGRFGIEVAKSGYVAAKTTVDLDPKNRGKGVPEVSVALKKDREAQGQARIQISVMGAGVPVEGASVRLTPLAGGTTLRGETPAGGVLQLQSAARGGFRLEVAHRNHQNYSQEVSLDGQNAAFSVALTAKEGAQEDSKVELFVTAADRKNANGQPAPLPGAGVVVGSSTQFTDETGRVLVSYTGQLGVNIRVEAPGYKPAFVSVDGARYALTTQVTRRVQLDPAEATEASPFTLIIRTTENTEPFTPIPNVEFRLVLPDGRSIGDRWKSGADGEVRINVPADVAALARRGLTVEVAPTAAHGPALTAIAPSLLAPSSEPSRYVVQLTSHFARDLAALNAEISRLEALKREIERAHELAWDDREAAANLADLVKAGIDARFGGKKPATPFKQMQQEADQACDRAARTAREHIRSADLLGNETVKSIETTQREAALCNSADGAARIDSGHRAALAKRNELATLSSRARRESDEFLKRVGDLEQEADNPLERIRELAGMAEKAAAGASAKMSEAGAAAGRLRKGHADATARLNELRARQSLTPAQFGQTVEPRRRLTPLPFDLQPPNDPARLAKIDADQAGLLLKELEARAGSFGRQGCVEARSAFPRAVDNVDTNLAALDFVLNRADLPALRDQCLRRVAAAEAAQKQDTAAAALVTVPDLAAIPRGQWAQAVQSAGLSWGGEILSQRVTPSTAQALQLMSQSLLPGTRVQPGVPLSAFVWGPYVPIPENPSQTTAPANTPATPPVAASGPSGATGLSAWEQLLRAAAAAAPGIAAAVNQHRNRPPSAPPAAPAVLPPGSTSLAPAAPAATGGVPYVLGDSLEQAQRKLAAAGLQVRGISRGGKPPSPELAGRVYHQNPAAGTALSLGLAADLMIYDNDRSTVTPPAPAVGGTTRYDRPTQGGVPIHQCATAGPWPNGDCGTEGAEYFCVKYKGHQRVFGFKTYTVSQSFRLRDGTRCVQGLCPALLEVVCQ